MNKLQEEGVLERFKMSYKNFPGGIISHPDKPDFIVENDDGVRYGIEITQVFQDDQQKGGSVLMQKGAYRRKILKKVKELLDASTTSPCIFSISLDLDSFTNNTNSDIVAKACFERIKTEIPSIKHKEYWIIDNVGDLPNIVESISIWIDEEYNKNEEVESVGGIGIPLQNKHVQFILNKKEDDLKKYQLCNEYWLIIKEGEFDADYFSIIDIDNSQLVSSFNKIFIIRQSDSEMIELK